MNKTQNMLTKKAISAVIAAVFIMTAGIPAIAKVTTCKVITVTDSEVVMTCTHPKNLKPGDTVRVKPKKKQAIEGC